MVKILVTGAGGFVGSGFLRRNPSYYIRALVRNTCPARLQARLAGVSSIEFIYGDLLGDISGICEGIDCVLHLAAKTYVDHSIRDPYAFLQNNVIGTFNLIEDARKHKVKKFIMCSTDECLGEILEGSYSEDAPSNPRNPYAASKSACEGLAMSYAHTYGMDTVITRMENIYGFYQHPQKVFPTFVRAAMRDEPLGVYGTGANIRQWLYLDDAIDAFLLLLEKDLPKGEVYHIAGNQELTNLELAKRILKVLGKSEELIKFIPDHEIRPGHDRRYALSCEKIKKLGWQAKVGLDEGIEKVVNWYKGNQWLHAN